MEENRIQNQIAIYMTNKKLCEFTDKLKPAPVEYYAHMHAQGEELPDGFRAYSCIGVVLQDYSKGKGDKTVRVTANLSPGFFPFALSRMQNDLDKFDFHEEKIFGEPDEHGLSTVTKLSIKRATIGTDGKPRNRRSVDSSCSPPYCCCAAARWASSCCFASRITLGQ